MTHVCNCSNTHFSLITKSFELASTISIEVIDMLRNMMCKIETFSNFKGKVSKLKLFDLNLLFLASIKSSKRINQKKYNSISAILIIFSYKNVTTGAVMTNFIPFIQATRNTSTAPETVE